MASYNDNYVYEEEYSRGKKKGKSTATLVISGVLAALLLAAAVLGIMALTRSYSTQEVEDVDLSNFAGRKLSNTQADGKYKKLRFKIEYVGSSGKDPGIILDQNPKDTKGVKANAEITLTVNGESQTVTIPPVKELTQMEAEEKLKALNLQYEIRQVEDDQTATGHMKDTVPAEGSGVAQSGTVVKLYVNRGPSFIKVSVSSVIGKDLDTTRTDILAVGLTVDAEITYVDDSDKTEGVVIETSSLPGIKVTEGTSTKVNVSSGKKSGKTIDIYVQLPLQVTHDIALKVYLDGTLYSKKTVNPSYSGVYQMSFRGISGQKTLIIQLSGQKYSTSLLDSDTGTSCQTESCMCQEPEDSFVGGTTRVP